MGRGLSALLPDVEKPDSGDGLVMAKVRSILPNPQQPRRDFKPDDLNDLSASIREKGIIQPLTVRKMGDHYELIAGERRLRASKLAGLEEVPVRVLEITEDVELLELSLIENLQRDDLNYVELAQGYYNLYHNYNLTQAEIAMRVGKDRATVANTLRVLELPSIIIASLRKGEITAGHAKAILAADGDARRSAIWKKVIRDQLSVRQTEQITRMGLESAQRIQPKEKKGLSPLLISFTDRMRLALGTKVKIAKRGKKGSIRIEFYSEEELERLVELLAEKRE